MSFDWKQFIDLSDYLLNSDAVDKSEALLRTIISRSYYGSFCECRAVKGLDIGPSRENVHALVINTYKNSDETSDKKIGADLGRLKRERLHADYEDNPPVSKPQAERAVRLANKIRAALN